MTNTSYISKALDTPMRSLYIEHAGTLGMKWGRRKDRRIYDREYNRLRRKTRKNERVSDKELDDLARSSQRIEPIERTLEIQWLSRINKKERESILNRARLTTTSYDDAYKAAKAIDKQDRSDLRWEIGRRTFEPIAAAYNVKLTRDFIKSKPSKDLPKDERKAINVVRRTEYAKKIIGNSALGRPAEDILTIRDHYRNPRRKFIRS